MAQPCVLCLLRMAHLSHGRTYQLAPAAAPPPRALPQDRP